MTRRFEVAGHTITPTHIIAAALIAVFVSWVGASAYVNYVNATNPLRGRSNGGIQFLKDGEPVGDPLWYEPVPIDPGKFTYNGQEVDSVDFIWNWDAVSDDPDSYVSVEVYASEGQGPYPLKASYTNQPLSSADASVTHWNSPLHNLIDAAELADGDVVYVGADVHFYIYSGDDVELDHVQFHIEAQLVWVDTAAEFTAYGVSITPFYY